VVCHSQVHFHAKRGHGADVAGECEVDGLMTKTKRTQAKSSATYMATLFDYINQPTISFAQCCEISVVTPSRTICSSCDLGTKPVFLLQGSGPRPCEYTWVPNQHFCF
jgi:hypothetical protein